MLNRLISIAPMMDCTDRHYRRLMRLITRQTLLYTEMLTTGAVIHGNREKLLGYSAAEQPLAFQVGGSMVKDLVEAAKIIEGYGYQEINLNVGCPSDRVQAGCFGAYLMKEPARVAACVAAMQAVVSLPITVKCRIGVDDLDSYENLCDFVTEVAKAGCCCFIIHARKAWLKGLSPADNRKIPPLRYEVVYQLKRDFPKLEIIMNGGIKTHADIQTHLQYVDGVMIGREAYSNPYGLANVDELYFDCSNPNLSRDEVFAEFLAYINQHVAEGVALRVFARHLMGLYQGQAGARAWRRALNQHCCTKTASLAAMRLL